MSADALIDLHTHSTRSDGTDTPTQLVASAAAAGVGVLALTDHDSTAGWDEASDAAEQYPLTLVRGLEISCEHNGRGVHLLAYEPDPAYPPLLHELERVLDGRNGRLPRTIERLRGLGIEISEADVRALSGDAVATGRPHVADALVAHGYVRNRDEAFDRYLKAGRPAYVHRYAAELIAMIELVRAAGGVSVIAHPWGRVAGTPIDRAGFADLRDAGLSGIEVDHNDHDPSARAVLREIAADLDMIATGSSDYHGVGKVDFDLACNTTAPAEYHRLRELIDAPS